MRAGRCNLRQLISTHAPLAGRDRLHVVVPSDVAISTHAPLAGRDSVYGDIVASDGEFQPTRPLRGATAEIREGTFTVEFQPTRPLRGATRRWKRYNPADSHFNPRAPCGARLVQTVEIPQDVRFQPTRPLRGATGAARGVSSHRKDFNPRAPCGARHQQAHHARDHAHFNPRAPCGARQKATAGVTLVPDFNPRAPCGARRVGECFMKGNFYISTHAPLAGRDHAGRKKNKKKYNFNPRAPCGARQQKCTNHHAHFCDNRQISDAFAQNAACQGILLLFDAGKPCGFWVRTAQVISAHLCFAL